MLPQRRKVWWLFKLGADTGAQLRELRRFLLLLPHVSVSTGVWCLEVCCVILLVSKVVWQLFGWGFLMRLLVKTDPFFTTYKVCSAHFDHFSKMFGFWLVCDVCKSVLQKISLAERILLVLITLILTCVIFLKSVLKKLAYRSVLCTLHTIYTS